MSPTSRGTPTGTLHRRGDGSRADGVVPHRGIRVPGVVERTRADEPAAAGKDYRWRGSSPPAAPYGERPVVTGAVRELAEETGKERTPDDLVLVGRVVEEGALFDLWVARIEGEPVPVPDPEEVQDAEWVTLDVVHQRWQDGVFAMPWNGRFDQLWERWSNGSQRCATASTAPRTAPFAGTPTKHPLRGDSPDGGDCSCAGRVVSALAGRGAYGTCTRRFGGGEGVADPARTRHRPGSSRSRPACREGPPLSAGPSVSGVAPGVRPRPDENGGTLVSGIRVRSVDVGEIRRRPKRMHAHAITTDTAAIT